MMEQYRLDLEPEARIAGEHLISAAEHMQEAIRGKIRARSAEEAYGRISSGFLCVKNLQKEAKKALDQMPASFTDERTSIELINRIREIASAITNIAVEWTVTANLCIKDMTFQRSDEEDDE